MKPCRALFVAFVFANALSIAGQSATYSQGQVVEVEYQGSWYAATVLKVSAKHAGDDGLPAPYFIHYTDYGSDWDEWVGPERLRATGAKASWVDGPWVLPPAGEDYTAFMIAKAGTAYILVNSSGQVLQNGKLLATVDRMFANLYRNGADWAEIDARGRVKVNGKQVARWDYGTTGLFVGNEETPRFTFQYGIIYKGDEPWGTALNINEEAAANDGALVLILICLVPEFKLP